MKYVLGFIVCVLVLISALYIVLGFWDITLFDGQDMINIYKTLGVVTVVSVLLVLIVSFFFKRTHKGYDTTKGSIAHPKK